ncbi:MAG: toll/interleukin-1 receptor domain-containing protein [Gammaproteobacteria bacterium]|nr:toll/interleukin-1 receptor domain-containing protein [Gammaproteobacteria bacterium]
MRPWTIDADDIQIAEDFDASLLHKTVWIEDFLDASRDDKFIVVGTKGFGKTLLLKAKRIRVQETGQLCLPQDTLLDKPVGDKVFSRGQVNVYESDIEPWNRIWLTSVACAVLKHTGLPEDLHLSPQFANLIHNAQLRSVLDHFVTLLDFSPGDMHRCAQETNTMLVPLLRSLNHPVAVFIDSVDEYFNKHIHTPIWRASFSGELSPDIWFLSQMSLVEVAYQLRRITKHLKVFVSVRKEAFERLAETSPMVQQYRGSAIDATYSENSLRQIFTNNILADRKSNLAAPERLSDDAIVAFLGLSSTTHGFTGGVEDAFGYIERHTLLRPRDLMTVGQKLAAVEPFERRVETIFKRVVNRAATEIAQEYLNEIAPHLGDVDLKGLLAAIPANVMTPDDLEHVADRYDQDYEHQGGATGMEAFARLYEMGLLGRVHTDPITGEQVQRFLSPGEISFGSARVLPASGHYLIRSVLSGYMAGINGDYAARTDRNNIIGNGREWQEPRQPVVRDGPVPAYHGSDPYVYVCYSHDDADNVLEEIRWLSQRGIKVWYDQGIPAGSRWSEELAARIRRSSVFLYFVSENSTTSNHCINEVNFVTDLDTPVLSVHIRKTELPDGLRLMLGATQTIRQYDASSSAYRRQLETVLKNILEGV